MDTDTVSRVAYDLALAQTAQAQAYLVTLGGVVSALGLFIGYKLFGLVQIVISAVGSNTEALKSLQETIREQSHGKD